MREKLQEDPDLFSFRGVEFVQNSERSKQLNGRQQPCIIISASGMMEAGRIRHHLRHSLGNERNTVLAVGFCAPGTLGAEILSGAEVVHIFGQPIRVKAEVARMEFFTAPTPTAANWCASSRARTPPGAAPLPGAWRGACPSMRWRNGSVRRAFRNRGPAQGRVSTCNYPQEASGSRAGTRGVHQLQEVKARPKTGKRNGPPASDTPGRPVPTDRPLISRMR